MAVVQEYGILRTSINRTDKYQQNSLLLCKVSDRRRGRRKGEREWTGTLEEEALLRPTNCVIRPDRGTWKDSTSGYNYLTNELLCTHTYCTTTYTTCNRMSISERSSQAERCTSSPLFILGRLHCGRVLIVTRQLRRSGSNRPNRTVTDCVLLYLTASQVHAKLIIHSTNHVACRVCKVFGRSDQPLLPPRLSHDFGISDLAL